MRNTLDNFKVGDRIELLLYYSFEPGPLPQGTVIRTITPRGLVKVKMDRTGKLVGFKPSDLRIISKKNSVSQRQTCLLSNCRLKFSNSENHWKVRAVGGEGVRPT